MEMGSYLLGHEKVSRGESGSRGDVWALYVQALILSFHGFALLIEQQFFFLLRYLLSDLGNGHGVQDLFLSVSVLYGFSKE